MKESKNGKESFGIILVKNLQIELLSGKRCSSRIGLGWDHSSIDSLMMRPMQDNKFPKK